mgnify:CR=1 FL=1
MRRLLMKFRLALKERFVHNLCRLFFVFVPNLDVEFASPEPCPAPAGALGPVLFRGGQLR